MNCVSSPHQPAEIASLQSLTLKEERRRTTQGHPSRRHFLILAFKVVLLFFATMAATHSLLRNSQLLLRVARNHCNPCSRRVGVLFYGNAAAAGLMLAHVPSLARLSALAPLCSARSVAQSAAHVFWVSLSSTQKTTFAGWFASLFFLEPENQQRQQQVEIIYTTDMKKNVNEFNNATSHNRKKSVMCTERP